MAIVLASAVASVVSLIVRFRRARGEERQQITWLLLVAIVAALIMLAMFVLERFGDRAARRPLARAPDGPRVRHPGSDGAGDLPLPPLRRRRRRLQDDRVRGLALGIALVYGALVIGLGRVDRRRVGPALRLGAAILVAIAVQPAWSLFNRLADRLVYGGRSTPYQVMAEFGDRIAQIPSVDELLPDMAEAAARGVGARAARVRMFLPGPEGRTGSGRRRGRRRPMSASPT